MILNKVYCRLEKDYGSKFKNSLFRVQGIQLLDSGGYMILLECMDDPNGRFITENILQVKPFLRPMEDMTEEEWDNYNDFCDSCRGEEFAELLEYLQSRYIDYRGLISKGLALKAPKEMYCNQEI